MNKYDKALRLHTGNDELRDWMMEPFYIENTVFATDAHSLIWIDKNLVSELKPYARPNPNNILSVIPESRNKNQILDIESIKLALENFPKVDGFDLIDNTIKCVSCNGEGEVEWEYEGYIKDFECPVCYGEGETGSVKSVPNGKKVPPDNLCIKLKGSIISMEQIKKVLKTKDVLEAENVVLVFNNLPYQPSIFKIDEAEVMVMPMREREDQNIFLTIE